MGKVDEFLAAADLCLLHAYQNASISRAYYAMFQAAIAAMKAADIESENWSHQALQAAFARELVHRRKVYPSSFVNALHPVMQVRLRADYEVQDVSMKVASRVLARAQEFVERIREETRL
ncbi:MAG: HEPN domain-containing protein [Armatimonadetes bacterium]|nr:HEPN domain-containing protein [Armatimonadota bacterium]